jgi:osmotically inducible protein OsmC
MANAERTATAVWHGNLFKGSGTVNSGSGAFSNLAVDWRARTESPNGETSPEELIAAAHAACYAMAFSNALDQAGHAPQELDVTAKVEFGPKEGGFEIKSSHLTVKGKVPGLNEDQFKKLAQEGEQGCPVSNALRNNIKITVDASLAS